MRKPLNRRTPSGTSMTPTPSEPRKYNNAEGNEVRKRRVEPIKIKSASDSVKPTVSNPNTRSTSMRNASNKKMIDSFSMVR
jgi:hypothetical protein